MVNNIGDSELFIEYHEAKKGKREEPRGNTFMKGYVQHKLTSSTGYARCFMNLGILNSCEYKWAEK